MKKLISHVWFAGGVKEFDTETGRITGISDKEWGSTGFGSLWRQNGKVFAFYRDDESLLLQYKTNKWRVTPEYTVSLRGFYFIRNFRIKQQGKVVFSIWYKPKGLFFFLIDPTYDAIDAEADDFFLYLKSMWASWGNKPYSEFLNEFGAENV
jgi:hypothetical protein